MLGPAVASYRRRVSVSSSRLAEQLAWFEGTYAGACLRTFVELRAIDRALALASKCFVALLPLSILSTAVISGNEFGDELVRRFGLTGSGAHAARLLFASPADVQSGVGLIGFVILLSSAFSLSRAFERVYLDTWQLEPTTGRAAINRRLAWLLSLVLMWAILVELHALFPHRRELISSAIASGVFFLWTPFVLLGHRVDWRRLLPTSAITGVATLALGIGSVIVMPGLMSRNTDRYGLVGLTFSLVSWLFAAALLIVTAAILGAELDRRLRPNGVMRRAPVGTSMAP
jgi:membrane protein